MKAILRQSLAVVGLAMSCSWVQAADSAHSAVLTVLWPQSEQTRDAYLKVNSAGLAESTIKMVSQRLNLTGPVTVVLGGGGKPRINAESQVVVLPYEHLQHIQDDLAASSNNGEVMPQVALDAFRYTLVHQLAHVAIAQQEESGQWLGEDAVADLTMLTLLEHMPDGDRIARNALRLFDKQAIGMVRPKDNFWASHSLNAERYWSGICQLLGSGQLIDEVLPAGEMDNTECAEHYVTLRNSWGQMFAQGLDPIAKGKVALR